MDLWRFKEEGPTGRMVSPFLIRCTRQIFRSRLVHSRRWAKTPGVSAHRATGRQLLGCLLLGCMVLRGKRLAGLGFYFVGQLGRAIDAEGCSGGDEVVFHLGSIGCSGVDRKST